jgi:hypothetical protein
MGARISGSQAGGQLGICFIHPDPAGDPGLRNLGYTYKKG